MGPGCKFCIGGTNVNCLARSFFLSCFQQFDNGLLHLHWCVGLGKILSDNGYAVKFAFLFLRHDGNIASCVHLP